MATTIFLRKQNTLVSKTRQHLCCLTNKRLTNIVPKHNNNYQYQHAKHYSRFSNFFRKTGKDIQAPPASAASAATFVPVAAGFIKSGLGSVSVSRVFSGFGVVGWYMGLIKSHPVVTKSLTCSLIYVAADLTSQTIALPSSEPYDFIRTLRMAGYGLVVLGPTLHYWFNFMSKILPGRDLLTTVKKMTLGQTVYGPLMTVIFFSLNAALQGEDAKEIVARLKRDLFPTMLNGVMYWPLCDFITFRFAPVHLQPLVSNGFSYIWTIYMTYMASLEKANE